jgi:1-phosphatidylinositol phosphodiesterase
VQDFYAITRSLPSGSGTAAYINAKFDAVTAHLTNATQPDLNPDQLYISFASAAFINDTTPVTPKVRMITQF